MIGFAQEWAPCERNTEEEANQLFTMLGTIKPLTNERQSAAPGGFPYVLHKSTCSCAFCCSAKFS
jgi:hypothetical protein